MINIVVEGQSDTQTAIAVVRAAGRTEGKVRVARGTGSLDPQIPKYNQAAAQQPWVVFRDSDSRCPVELRAELSTAIMSWNPQFSLRIAHSMSEAWLLADVESFAEYFRVAKARIGSDPESHRHAKRALLDLCAQSRSREVREDMTAPGSKPGPLYVARINEFASTVWRPSVAAEVSPSLERAIRRIASL